MFSPPCIAKPQLATNHGPVHQRQPIKPRSASSHQLPTIVARRKANSQFEILESRAYEYLMLSCQFPSAKSLRHCESSTFLLFSPSSGLRSLNQTTWTNRPAQIKIQQLERVLYPPAAFCFDRSSAEKHRAPPRCADRVHPTTNHRLTFPLLQCPADSLHLLVQMLLKLSFLKHRQRCWNFGCKILLLF